MLAQNFKSAADLHMQDDEYAALIKVLGMLERGELRHVDDWQHTRGKLLFNMETSGERINKNMCGTPACIGGWVAFLIGYKDTLQYVSSRRGELHKLYWQAPDGYITVEQAARATRNFLVTGAPDWAQVLA